MQEDPLSRRPPTMLSGTICARTSSATHWRAPFSRHKTVPVDLGARGRRDNWRRLLLRSRATRPRRGDCQRIWPQSEEAWGDVPTSASTPQSAREPSHESAERSSQGVVDVARVLLLHTNSTFSTHSHQNWEDHTWLKSQLTFECPAAFRSRSSRATR